MAKLIWSARALLDVQRLHAFLTGKYPQAATRAVRAVRLGMRTIAQHPEAGRTTVDLPVEFREWLIDFGDSGYVVLYRWDGTTVVVLAVRHQREAGY